ncbi:MAG: hypothetical protein ACIARR_00875 [Phycisphaerales bacterium JB059]
MDARRVLVWIMGLMAGLALVGCAATREIGAGSRPADFSLDALVRDPAGRGEGAKRWRRPARYLVGADGTLRVAFGPGVNERTIPRLARTLDAGQLDELWAMVEAAELTRPDSARAIEWGDTWAPPANEPSVVLSVTANGRRVHRAAALGASSGLGAPRIEALLDRLGAWSWMPEE